MGTEVAVGEVLGAAVPEDEPLPLGAPLRVDVPVSLVERVAEALPVCERVGELLAGAVAVEDELVVPIAVGLIVPVCGGVRVLVGAGVSVPVCEGLLEPVAMLEREAVGLVIDGDGADVPVEDAGEPVTVDEGDAMTHRSTLSTSRAAKLSPKLRTWNCSRCGLPAGMVKGPTRSQPVTAVLPAVKRLRFMSTVVS